MQKLEKSIYDRSHIYFLLFFGLVVGAFWITYFTRFFEQESYRMHLHGITLVIWCLMLFAQPYLIKKRLNNIHKIIGKFSYFLVPILLFTTYDLLKFRTHANRPIDYTFIALVINALVAFIILYGLAIYNRKKSSIHARYMICTVFPFFTPVTDRIIAIYFPSTIKFFPLINGIPYIPLFGFLLADIILIILSILDYRSHKRLNIFPVALIILLIYHFSVTTFYQFNFWRKFSDWLME